MACQAGQTAGIHIWRNLQRRYVTWNWHQLLGVFPPFSLEVQGIYTACPRQSFRMIYYLSLSIETRCRRDTNDISISLVNYWDPYLFTTLLFHNSIIHSRYICISLISTSICVTKPFNVFFVGIEHYLYIYFTSNSRSTWIEIENTSVLFLYITRMIMLVKISLLFFQFARFISFNLLELCVFLRSYLLRALCTSCWPFPLATCPNLLWM